MRMRILMFTIACCLAPITLSAQSVGELWKEMPSEFVAYLSAGDRAEMIERHNLMLDTSVTNALQDISYIDTLSDTYGRFVLSSARTIELVLLPSAGDTLLCFIDTYELGGKKSILSFYDIDWSLVDIAFPMPSFEITPAMFKGDDSDTFTPYGEGLENSFYLCSVAFDPALEEFVVNFSLPFLSVEEKERIDLSKCEQRLKWTGEEFVTVIKT